MEELRYVLAVNMHRRDLDEFQKGDGDDCVEDEDCKLDSNRKEARLDVRFEDC
jgi:hypothetical protein